MIGVVAFWLVMMGLLIRLETHPDATDILDVPVSYVMRLVFQHGQQSLLTVRDESGAIGNVSLRPEITGTDGRVMNFSGSLEPQLAGLGRQRLNFGGAVNMDATLKMRDFHLDLNVQESHYHVTVAGDAERNQLRYEVRQGSHWVTSQTLPMNAAALEPALMQSMGLDGKTIPISPVSMQPPDLTARETELALHGEKLEVYEVSAKVGTASMADLYVTQLGQVVMVKTAFGYSLTGEDFQ